MKNIGTQETNGLLNDTDNLVSTLISAKEGELVKVGSDLALLSAGFTLNNSLQVDGDRVVIDAMASGDLNTLVNDLVDFDFEQIATFGHTVSGFLPIDAIEEVASLSSLEFARPEYQGTGNVGSTTSQADEAMNADDVRNNLFLDGTGISIGVLSDSFNTSGNGSEQQDIQSGDLPGSGNPNGYTNDVNVLQDSNFGDDEGRAMLQLIHDIAPGANLLFHRSNQGINDFANGIGELVNAGADIIVDDWTYFAEPFFQNGRIAQAANDAVEAGVAFFTSAGNEQNNPRYQNAFNPGTTYNTNHFSGGFFDGGTAHEFAPGDDMQEFILDANEAINITLQWDDPFAVASNSGTGSTRDLDIYVLDQNNNVVGSSTDPNVGNNALERLYYQNNTNSPQTLNLMIVNQRNQGDGTDPNIIKYIDFEEDAIFTEYTDNSPTVIGHHNTTRVAAVGAAPYFDTPEFGTNPPLLENFSSLGGVPLLFDENGNSINETPNQPRFTAPDGTNNTFFGNDINNDNDGFPNFFGTSAAAPHAAAVAALMFEANPNLSPDEIYTQLANSAIDMDAPGFDFASGAGLIQADRAIPFNPFNPQTGNSQQLVDGLLADNSGLAVNSNSINFQGGTGSTSFYSGGLDELNIDAGILLTSGDGTPPLENTSSDYTVSLGLPGDPDLDEVADNAFPGSGGTNDANTLEFSFTLDESLPVLDESLGGLIKFSLVFGSEEFPEFSNSAFVDAAAVLVNGENVAFFDQNESQPLSVIDENLMQGNFINNQSGDLPIEYDGVSSPLSIIAPVQPGENTIKIGVADTGDEFFDSGLFVSNLQALDISDGIPFDIPDGLLLLDLLGAEDSDNLTGTDANEFIEAFGGDDTIDPGAGNDLVLAGAGDDTIQGGQGDNQINGGSGIDTANYSVSFADSLIQVDNQIITVGSNSDKLFNVEFIQFTDTTVSTTFLDTLSLSVTDAEQSEGDSGTTPFTFTVTRPDNITGEVEFNYEVTGSGDNPADADDFGGTLPSGTITFTGEETEKQITVDVTADTVVEPDEEFTLTLSSPDAGDDVTQPTATATIINDDEETEPNEITGTPGRDELTGTSENDSLTGGFGADILTGEAGSDQFIYESIRDAGDTITDFEIGSDQIVLTEVLDSFGYDGSDALADGYVQVVEMGSNSAVQIDSDGPDGRGIFRPFILVENVAAADLSAASNFAF